MSTFERFSNRVADLSGSAKTFIVALTMIVSWLLSGPFFGFSDTWQLIINTSTTIITFLMVFLIQNTQNRDTTEIKVAVYEVRDEMRALILAIPGIDNQVIEDARRRAQEKEQRKE